VVGHIPSAIMQWWIVNGIKRITIPFYFVFIVMHVYTTWVLHVEPMSMQALFEQVIALHGYAYVRAGIHCFILFDIASPHEYTISILLAAMFTTPLVFGMLGNFLYIFSFVGFNGIVFPLMDFSGCGAKKIFHQTWYAFKASTSDILNHEFARDTLGITAEGIDSGTAVLAKHLKSIDTAEESQNGPETRLVFAGGLLGVAAGLDVAQAAMPMFENMSPDTLRLVRALPAEAKAEIAFNMLSPHGETIHRRRWGAFMMVWCMTKWDVDATLHSFKDDEMTLEMFTKHWPVIYNYMVDMLYSHGSIVKDLEKLEMHDFRWMPSMPLTPTTPTTPTTRSLNRQPTQSSSLPFSWK